MKNKTITVSEKNSNRLNKLKYELGCKTINEVIERIFIIIKRFKLAGELK